MGMSFENLACNGEQLHSGAVWVKYKLNMESGILFLSPQFLTRYFSPFFLCELLQSHCRDLLFSLSILKVSSSASG